MNYKILFLYTSLSSVLLSTWFEKIPRVIYQPDGQRIDCFVTGDQYARRLHDIDDFTIVLNQVDGFYYYADLFNGVLIPSEWKVGQDNPENLGLKPGLFLSREEYKKSKELYNRSLNNSFRDAPTSGQINQINIFIRFADDPEFTEPRSYYNQIFQSDEEEPSLQHYFSEISSDALFIRTYHYPATTDGVNIAYVDDYNRSYYQPYSANNPNGYTEDQRTEREHALLANAVNFISSEVSSTLNIDGNNDGYVDGVSFVVYGNPGDWATLLWPHRWALFSETVLINNVQVYDYMFMLSESWYYNVGVLCHEFGHVLGAPDYYHYDGGGAPTPVGGWDLMASNGNPPQYPSAYTKWKYFDWLPQIPEITIGGSYTLYPMTQQENVAYKMASPNSETEYFVFEYRKQEGMYESNLPGTRSGLLVYRINTDAGNGNAQGPPDELYVYRPGGDLNATGDLNSAPFSEDYNHTEFNDNTDPSPFLYNDGSGEAGGLNLFNISGSAESISFNVIYGVPELSISEEQLNFDLGNGDIGNETLIFSNVGEEGTILDYSISILGDTPFEDIFSGPDGGNYYWSLSNESNDLNYEWIDIEEICTEINFNHNDEFSSQVLSIPFTFEFYDQVYDYVQVNANGWIGWNSANETVWSNLEIPSQSAPRPAIFGFFDDLNPENTNGNSNAAGNVFYHVNNNRLVIWFNDVVRWNVEDWGEFDFQIVLYPDGMFRVNYREMSGVVNSASIGFQNITGTEGTQIAFNQSFVENNLSWVAQSSDGNIPWLYVSTASGDLSGFLMNGESEEIYVSAITSGLDPGNYNANILINSDLADPAIIPITLNLTLQDSIPQLPIIDISDSEDGIVDIPDNINSLFSSIFSRYTHISVPNGNVIQLIAQEQINDSKILHVRGVLESYLQDYPGSQWGDDKSSISNAIASNNAILFLLNSESEIDNPDLISLFDSGVNGQIILSNTIHIEGDTIYLNSTSKDMTYEKILNFITKNGIELVMPSMKNYLESAMNYAILNDFYIVSSDSIEENDFMRYFSLGLETYYGLWAHDPNGDGFAGEHEYAFINRQQMANGDSLLFNIINGFFEENWSYNAYISESFNGIFYLDLNSEFIYTLRSQYIRNASLTGENESSIFGNNYINFFIGNEGNNNFFGFGGNDTLIGGMGIDRTIYSGDFNDYIVVPMGEPSDSSYMIIDIVNNRDGIDYIKNIEQIQFNGELYNILDLLDIENENLPTKFSLNKPYPNPFNPFINISFDIAKSSQVSLVVYDLAGHYIKTLSDSYLNPGRHQLIWDAQDEYGKIVSTGVYLIKFIVEDYYQKTEKILFLK